MPVRPRPGRAVAAVALLAFGAMWTEEVVAEPPAWRHIPSGVVFRAVPGGTFRMGLSEAELAAVRSIERSGGAEDTLAPFFAAAGNAQPVRQVRVEPFLIARHPLTVARVQHWLPEYEDDYAEVESGTARLADDLADLLAALPFRLPTEAEWEYAARGSPGRRPPTHRRRAQGGTRRCRRRLPVAGLRRMAHRGR